MTATTIRVQMAQRKDTAAGWTAANPILLLGEIGYETDTKKFKIGDGTTNWNSLAYLPIPDGSGNLTITGNLEIGTTGSLTFEGSTADGFETTLAVTDPTADRTITLPDVTGTVVTTGDTGSVTSTMLADGTIVNADINASAEIAVSKLANGTANQVLVTDGTDVSWSDNLTLAGDLTVNGTTTTINTQDLLVEDKNIIIGNVATPTDVTADGGGITLKGSTDKTINWVDATDAWTSSERFNVPSGTAAAPSLIFNGDVNSGLYSPGADQVAISSNGVGRVFIDSSGRLGLATSSPGEKLTVAGGAIQLQGSTYTDFSDYWGSSDNEAIFLPYGSLGSSGAFNVSLYANGYRNLDPGFTYMGIGGNTSTAAGIDLSPAGQIFFRTGTATGTSLPTRMFIDSSGNVGIGTASPATLLHAEGTQSSAGEGLVRIRNNYTTSGRPSWGIGITRQNSATRALLLGSDDASNASIGVNGSNALVFGKEISGTWSENVRIDNSARLLVGTSTSRSNWANTTGTDPLFQIETSGNTRASITRTSANEFGPQFWFGKTRGAAYQVVSSDDQLGEISFMGADGSELVSAASITALVDGTPGANDMPGRLSFSTTADGASSPTERMRITQAGNIWFGNNAIVEGSGSVDGGTFYSSGIIGISTNNDRALFLKRRSSNGNIATFNRDSTTVGSISVTTTATAYNTSSDYRLKENVVPLTGAADRLNQLQVKRFNFIADPDKTVDGFLAHEAQAVVPECVTGTKDEVDDESNPVYQGIDQSKLVPLLTAALQEALAEIESLKARLTAAGI